MMHQKSVSLHVIHCGRPTVPCLESYFSYCPRKLEITFRSIDLWCVLIGLLMALTFLSIIVLLSSYCFTFNIIETNEMYKLLEAVSYPRSKLIPEVS